MSGRNMQDPHRSSSPLEALFDLTTVIAVAASASRLHHDLASEHYVQAVIDLSILFFTAWSAWMNFTWFSSAYDTDDIGYRATQKAPLSGPVCCALSVQAH